MSKADYYENTKERVMSYKVFKSMSIYSILTALRTSNKAPKKGV